MSIVVADSSIDSLLGLYILVSSNRVSAIVIPCDPDMYPQGNTDECFGSICALLACIVPSSNIPIFYHKVNTSTYYNKYTYRYLYDRATYKEYTIYPIEDMDVQGMSCISFSHMNTVRCMAQLYLISSAYILDAEYETSIDIPIQYYYSTRFPIDLMLKSRMIVLSNAFLYSMVPGNDNLDVMSGYQFQGMTYALHLVGSYQ